MRYINTETGYWPLSLEDIKAALPTTLFRIPPEPYKQIFDAPRPGCDNILEYAIETTPVLTAKGTWEQQWVVHKKFATQEEETAALAVDAEKRLAEFQSQVVQRVQQRLDDFAKTRNYDSILSAATYATSSIARFRLEGQYAVDARDNTWATLYSIMEQALAGQIAMPTSYEQIDSLLPELVWPSE